MSLPYREERIARRIDRALSQSDPDLASMLSIFAEVGAADAMPARERLRPRLAWALKVLRGAAAALSCLVAFIAGGGCRGCRAALGRPAYRRDLGRLFRHIRSGQGSSEHDREDFLLLRR